MLDDLLEIGFERCIQLSWMKRFLLSHFTKYEKKVMCLYF